MQALWRAVRVIVGVAWGGALTLMGVACFDRPPAWLGGSPGAAAGVGLIGAGQYVLMTVAADAAYPRAARVVTAPLKLAASLVFWGGGGVCLYLWTAG